jgi:hypothetical protein
VKFVYSAAEARRKTEAEVFLLFKSQTLRQRFSFFCLDDVTFLVSKKPYP